jgi:hypothetical protein
MVRGAQILDANHCVADDHPSDHLAVVATVAL